jgi:hypothetical protein
MRPGIGVRKELERALRKGFGTRPRERVNHHSNNSVICEHEILKFHNNPNFSNIIRAPESMPPDRAWKNLPAPEEVEKWTN